MFSFCCQSRNVETSKAIGVDNFGEIKRVVRMKKIFIPPLDDHQVLIEIKAVALSNIECKLIQRNYQDRIKMKFPYILGRQFAGIIASKGSKSEYKIGDKVFGFIPLPNNGALSEYYVTYDHFIAKILSMPFDQAVLYPLGISIGLDVLNKLGAEKKSKILISDPTLSITPFLIPLLKDKGAYIVCIVFDDKNPSAKGLGIDDFIVVEFGYVDLVDYQREFDYVIDYGYLGEMLFPVLKHGGKFISIDIPLPEYPAKNLGIFYIHLPIIPNPENLKKIVKLMHSKVFKQPRYKTYEFLDSIDALLQLDQDMNNENIVINVDQEIIKKTLQNIDKQKVNKSKSSQNVSVAKIDSPATISRSSSMMFQAKGKSKQQQEQ